MTTQEVQVQRQCPDCGGYGEAGEAGEIDETMSRDAFGDDRAVGTVIDCTTCGGAGWVSDVDVIEVPDGE